MLLTINTLPYKLTKPSYGTTPMALILNTLRTRVAMVLALNTLSAGLPMPTRKTGPGSPFDTLGCAKRSARERGPVRLTP
jgi:hypothetical protein